MDSGVRAAGPHRHKPQRQPLAAQEEIMKKSGVLLFCLLLAGCATSFKGSAKVEGPDDCRKICGKWEMDSPEHARKREPVFVVE